MKRELDQGLLNTNNTGSKGPSVFYP